MKKLKMRSKLTRELCAVAIIIAFLCFAGYTQENEAKKENPQRSGGIVFSDEAAIKTDVEKVPCDSDERLEGVKKLFINSGATESDVKIEDFGHVKNLVVEKKGAGEETVVIGAHYDKLDSCGAIDNWTGIVIIAHIYKTLKGLNTKKTYKFAAFGQEERGLIGSKAMAGAIPKEEREKYCAMVNFDSFGFTYPQVMRNVSSGKLIKLAKETAKRMKMPFGAVSIQNASTDSASFLDKGIPAVGFHGLDSKWRDYLHTPQDKLKNVNSQSVYFAYRYGVVFLASIENSPCEAYR